MALEPGTTLAGYRMPRRYGRWPFLVSPRRLRAMPHYFLVSAQRSQA